MTSWIKRGLLGLFGISIALGALTACGHRAGHHGMGEMSAEDQAKFREKVLSRVASRLDLDAGQKAKLGTLADKVQALRIALRGQRADVESIIAGEKFDRAKAQALVTQKTSAVATASPEVIAALGDFYDSLNPTQQGKVREYLQKRRSGGGWWLHHG